MAMVGVGLSSQAFCKTASPLPVVDKPSIRKDSVLCFLDLAVMVSDIDRISRPVRDRTYPCFIRPILVAWLGFGYRHGKWYFV